MKPAARLLGWLVAIVAGAFFVRHAWTALRQPDLHDLLSIPSGMALAALFAIYLAQIPFTAAGWRWQLRDLRTGLSYRQALATLGVTQFGKYLPGNIAQHLGRVALARRFGGSLATLGLSLAYEMLIALLAASHIAVVVLLWLAPGPLAGWLGGVNRHLLLSALGVACVAMLWALPRAAGWWMRRRGSTERRAQALQLRWTTIVVCYLVFVGNFILMGFGLALLAHAFAPEHGMPVFTMAGAFAAAWVLGFVTPGAPAGLGVREGILLAWLSAPLGAAVAATTIILLRVVTTLGDLTWLLFGGLLMRGLRPGGSG